MGKKKRKSKQGEEEFDGDETNRLTFETLVSGTNTGSFTD
jgi:hypothetical protein